MQREFEDKVRRLEKQLSQVQIKEAQAEAAAALGNTAFKVGDLGDTLKDVEGVLEKRYEVSAGKARVAKDMVDMARDPGEGGRAQGARAERARRVPRLAGHAGRRAAASDAVGREADRAFVTRRRHRVTRRPSGAYRRHGTEAFETHPARPAHLAGAGRRADRARRLSRQQSLQDRADAAADDAAAAAAAAATPARRRRSSTSRRKCRGSTPAAPFTLKDNIVPIEISEYAGYAGLIAANGGLEPSENSVFFKNGGFKVKLTVSEDESWGDLNQGKIAGSVTTVDVLAVYGRQFHAVVPAQIGYSRGADGLIVRNEIKKINDLKGKVVATSQFTEADFFLRYLAQEAGLQVNVAQQPRRHAQRRSHQPGLHRGRRRRPASCSCTTSSRAATSWPAR